MQIKIMRGLPGSGKNHYIDNVVKKLLCPDTTDLVRVAMVSADDGMLEDGKYVFKPEKLPKAHDNCLSRFLNNLITSGQKLIFGNHPDILVVNNTNLTAWELAPYVRLSEIYGFTPEIIYIKADPLLCAQRNVHGVDAVKIGMMYQTLLTERLPPFWKQTVIES